MAWHPRIISFRLRATRPISANTTIDRIMLAEPAAVLKGEQTVAALDRALAETASHSPREELIAEELRGASSALGRLTSRVDVEDVLDKIFREFCIGK